MREKWERECEPMLTAARAALSAAPPAETPDVPTGVGDTGREPLPPKARRLVLSMPSRMEVVTFPSTDRPGYANEVHGYTLDVTNGKPTRIRSRGWSETPSLEEAHSLVMTWFDHELREQMCMDPHKPAAPTGGACAECGAGLWSSVHGPDGSHTFAAPTPSGAVPQGDHNYAPAGRFMICKRCGMRSDPVHSKTCVARMAELLDQARAERDAMRAVVEAATDLMTLHDHPNEAYRNEQKAAKWYTLRKALRGVAQ
jgi:hypothetical protein